MVDVRLIRFAHPKDEDLLKQLRSREEVIASHGDAHSDMVSQTKEQIQKVGTCVFSDGS